MPSLKRKRTSPLWNTFDQGISTSDSDDPDDDLPVLNLIIDKRTGETTGRFASEDGEGPDILLSSPMTRGTLRAQSGRRNRPTTTRQGQSTVRTNVLTTSSESGASRRSASEPIVLDDDADFVQLSTDTPYVSTRTRLPRSPVVSDFENAPSAKTPIRKRVRRVLSPSFSDFEHVRASSDDESNPPAPASTKTRRCPVASSDSEHDTGPVEEFHTHRITRRASQTSMGTVEEDQNDLHFTPPPCSSRPSHKEHKASVREALRTARSHKAQGIPRTPAEVHTLSSSECASDDDSDTETGAFGHSSRSGSENLTDFIDDADEETGDIKEVDDVLAPGRVNRFSTRKHFQACAVYLARLHHPTGTSLTPEQERDCQVSLTKIQDCTTAVADSMQKSTWTRPFLYTIDERPILVGPYNAEEAECQACWTRGDYECNRLGTQYVATCKGFYERKGVFQDVLEENVEYSTETPGDWENSALAPKILYPPQHRIYLGKRCAERIVAYHAARHYMYYLSSRIKDEVERECSEDQRSEDDVDRLVERLSRFLRQLDEDFGRDRRSWHNFGAGGLFEETDEEDVDE